VFDSFASMVSSLFDQSIAGISLLIELKSSFAQQSTITENALLRYPIARIPQWSLFPSSGSCEVDVTNASSRVWTRSRLINLGFVVSLLLHKTHFNSEADITMLNSLSHNSSISLHHAWYSPDFLVLCSLVYFVLWSYVYAWYSLCCLLVASITCH